MKIKILKNKLKEGLNIVERISGKSINLPILNNILFSVEKNFLNLSATDLEIGINWWSLIKKDKEGKAAIPSKILSSFINFLPEKPIELNLKNLDLEVSCEKYKTLIKGVNPEDFPIIPKGEEKKDKFKKVEIQAKIFCQALASVVDIAGTSSIKPEISGVYLLFQKNLITIAATDSFRLAEKKITSSNFSTDISQDISLIIPQKTAREVISIFTEKEGVLNIYLSTGEIFFENYLSEVSHPEINLTSRLIDGDYPNYYEIIPKKQETSITFSLEEFINQIKMASLFSGKINEIKITANPEKNRIDFFSQNPEVGEYKSFLDCKIEGRPCQVSFNYRFLLDGLMGINSSQKNKKGEALMELTGSEKPGVLKPKGDDNYLYLIMPIKNT
jgi:DNA polymerase III subunit beta